MPKKPGAQFHAWRDENVARAVSAFRDWQKFEHTVEFCETYRLWIFGWHKKEKEQNV